MCSKIKDFGAQKTSKNAFVLKNKGKWTKKRQKMAILMAGDSKGVKKGSKKGGFGGQK